MNVAVSGAKEAKQIATFVDRPQETLVHTERITIPGRRVGMRPGERIQYPDPFPQRTPEQVAARRKPLQVRRMEEERAKRRAAAASKKGNKALPGSL